MFANGVSKYSFTTMFHPIRSVVSVCTPEPSTHPPAPHLFEVACRPHSVVHNSYII